MDAPTQTLRMSRQEYRAWAEGRDGKYELVRGEVVRMPAERTVHALVKAQIWSIFRREIRSQGLSCQALPDGMTVEIGPDTDYEPDAIINCGPRMADDDIAAPNPVVVVEVLSPGTRRVDLSRKFADYFRVPSIQHYMIVSIAPDEVIHHRSGAAGVIESRVIQEGVIALDPPGIAVTVAEIFAER